MEGMDDEGTKDEGWMTTHPSAGTRRSARAVSARPRLRYLQGRADQSSTFPGSYFQRAAKLPQPLAHACEPNAAESRFDQFALLLQRYALSMILNLNRKTVAF